MRISNDISERESALPWDKGKGKETGKTLFKGCIQ